MLGQTARAARSRQFIFFVLLGLKIRKLGTAFIPVSLLQRRCAERAAVRGWGAPAQPAGGGGGARGARQRQIGSDCSLLEFPRTLPGAA